MPDKGTGRVDGHLSGDKGKLGCLDPRDLHIWRARLAKFDGIEDLDVGHATSLESGRSMRVEKCLGVSMIGFFEVLRCQRRRLVTPTVRPTDLLPHWVSAER